MLLPSLQLKLQSGDISFKFAALGAGPQQRDYSKEELKQICFVEFYVLWLNKKTLWRHCRVHRHVLL